MKKSRCVIKFVLSRFLFLTICILSANTIVQASAQNCFADVKLEPAFIAYTSKKESGLGAWYQKVFGLEIVKEFSFPDGSVTGVLMRKDEFVVEVFYHDSAKSIQVEHPEGVKKWGVFSNANLSVLKQCLTTSGVKAGRIWKDKNLGIDMLQVIDQRNNVLEIIARRK